MAGEVLHEECEGEAVWGHHGLGRGPSKCQGQRGIAPGVLKDQWGRLRPEDLAASIRLCLLLQTYKRFGG